MRLCNHKEHSTRNRNERVAFMARTLHITTCPRCTSAQRHSTAHISQHRRQYYVHHRKQPIVNFSSTVHKITTDGHVYNLHSGANYLVRLVRAHIETVKVFLYTFSIHLFIFKLRISFNRDKIEHELLKQSVERKA